MFFCLGASAVTKTRKCIGFVIKRVVFVAGLFGFKGGTAGMARVYRLYKRGAWSAWRLYHVCIATA